jgi:hypothetical protein
VAGAEKARIAMDLSTLEAALKYKHESKVEDAQYRKEGKTPPPRYPDPDDILVDVFTGKVTVDGPLTWEQAAAMAALEEMIPENAKRMFEVAQELSKNPKNKKLREEQKGLQVFFDYLGRTAPRRIRKQFEQMSKEAMERAESKSKPRKMQNSNGR